GGAVRRGVRTPGRRDQDVRQRDVCPAAVAFHPRADRGPRRHLWLVPEVRRGPRLARGWAGAWLLIVKREADGWTLIRQMDHAAHCGEISRAWRSGPFGDKAVSHSLEYAAATHDLGWAEVDGQPEIDGEGKPRNFTTFEEARHATFYSAAVRTIAETDKHAAYLVSLH